MSYIIPSAWLGGPRYIPLRKFLLDRQIDTIVMLPFDVFKDAYIDTAVLVVAEDQPDSSHVVRTYTYGKREKIAAIGLADQDYEEVPQETWRSLDDNKYVLDPSTVRLLRRLSETCDRTIGDVALVKRGVLFDDSLLVDSRKTHNHHRYFEGDVYRYRANMQLGHWVEFGDEMSEKPKDFFWFEGTRILLRRLVNRQQRLMATLATETFITNKNLYSVITADEDLDAHALLAVLNSKLVSYLYLKQVSQATKDDFPQVTIRDIRALVFPSETSLQGMSTRLVPAVQRMLDLHKRLATATIPADKNLYQRQVEATDEEIDALVYELYGLTEEEIAIVERCAQRPIC